MKRIFLYLLFTFSLVTGAMADTLTLSSHYPIPFGAYDRIRLNPRDAMTCDTTTEGLIYYDSTSHEVLMCDQAANWIPLVGYWTESGNNLYPIGYSNSLQRVGIGTNFGATGINYFKLNIDYGNSIPSYIHDGGIFSQGTFGQGTDLGNIGPGTYMIWHPKKSAFRAGRVTGNQWDEANIGAYSAAFGLNTIASGQNSTAFGDSTIASGTASTAMGQQTQALGIASTAMGFQTIAQGDYSTAMGNGTLASGIASTAMGTNTQATGDYSTAMGNGTIAAGTASTAMGDQTQANGDNSFAMGEQTIADGVDSFAAGYKSQAKGDYSIALGDQTVALGPSSFATGLKTTAMHESCLAFGHNSISGGHASFASGKDSHAFGYSAAAMGFHLGVSSMATMAVGACNIEVSGYQQQWEPTDPIFVVGNGTPDYANDTCITTSNALTVHKNGVTRIGPGAALPTCDATTNGGMYFFNGHFYLCNSSIPQWKQLDN